MNRHMNMNTFLGAFLLLLPSLVAAQIDASRILIIYNANWPTDSDQDGQQDSLQVAEYYAAKRGVPAANMIGVSCSTGTRYYYSSHLDFYSEVIVPVQAKLADLPYSILHRHGLQWSRDVIRRPG